MRRRLALEHDVQHRVQPGRAGQRGAQLTLVDRDRPRRRSCRRARRARAHACACAGTRAIRAACVPSLPGEISPRPRRRMIAKSLCFRNTSSLARLADVEVDAEEEERPEHDREQARGEPTSRVQVVQVVLRGGDQDAGHEIGDEDESARHDDHARMLRELRRDRGPERVGARPGELRQLPQHDRKPRAARARAARAARSLGAPIQTFVTKCRMLDPGSDKCAQETLPV